MQYIASNIPENSFLIIKRAVLWRWLDTHVFIFHKNGENNQQGSEAVVQRCSVKKGVLKTSQNSQENNCARVSFLVKLQAWGLQFY